MAQVTSRYNYPDGVERRIMDQQYYDMEARKQLEKKLAHLDEKARDTVMQMETARQELYKMRTVNKALNAKIEAEETEVKGLHTKVGSLKVKLCVANANLSTGNDEKEKLRTSLNEIQVEVARLEERLTASTAELDRLRDPANPESNMSIRKHVTSDKKEIKRLKADIDNETKMLEIDKETVVAKDAKIRTLEKELAKMKGLLAECETDRQKAQDEEEFERKRKEELINEFQNLKIDRKSYDKRMKELKVKLGISVANQNVSTKFAEQLKLEDKALAKKLSQIEKKLKDFTGQLDVLKNQHKMSKTAQSINEYTRRNQSKRGSAGRVSLAQSGTGPIKFGSSAPKDQSKMSSQASTKGSMQSIPEKLKAVDVAKEKQNGGKAAASGQPAGKQNGDKQATSAQPAGKQNGDKPAASGQPAGKQNGGKTATSGQPAGKQNGDKPTASGQPTIKQNGGKGVISTASKANDAKQKGDSSQRSVASRSTAASEKSKNNQLVPLPKPKLSSKTTPR